MSLKVYINGKLYDKEDAKISVYDHGLLYGDGVFEGIRSYDGKVFRLTEHLDRLWDSAKAIWLEIPISPRGDGQGHQRHAGGQRRSRTATSALVVTRGAGTLGPRPQPLQQSAGDHHHRLHRALSRRSCTRTGWRSSRSARCATTRPRSSPRIKSLNYLNNILAKIEGMQAGCIEALMLNHKGEVAECTGDNIFLVRDGGLLTPPTDAGILEGITRERRDRTGPRERACEVARNRR